MQGIEKQELPDSLKIFTSVPCESPFWTRLSKKILRIWCSYEKHDPSTHTTLFWRPYDVVLTLWTLYRRQNDVVCLLGYKISFWDIRGWSMVLGGVIILDAYVMYVILLVIFIIKHPQTKLICRENWKYLIGVFLWELPRCYNNRWLWFLKVFK